MTSAARALDVTKMYVMDGETVHALRGITLDVPVGDYVAIMGTSGSGKSTLLNLLGCLDRPTSGRLLLGDEELSHATDDRLSEIRASHIGFVFQSYNLIPQLTVLENIEVPLYYQGRLARHERQRSRELAEMVGLGQRLKHRPTQLSGGQQQRVAIARSLINDPYFILADEPTGNLDSATTEEILQLLERLEPAGQDHHHGDPRARRRQPRQAHRAAARRHDLRRRSPPRLNHVLLLAPHLAIGHQELALAPAAVALDGAGHLHRRGQRDLALGHRRGDQPQGPGADRRAGGQQHHRPLDQAARGIGRKLQQHQQRRALRNHPRRLRPAVDNHPHDRPGAADPRAAVPLRLSEPCWSRGGWSAARPSTPR